MFDNSDFKSSLLLCVYSWPKKNDQTFLAIPISFYFHSKPVLPVEMEFLERDRPLQDDAVESPEWETHDIVQQAKKMAELKEKIYDKVESNIKNAQRKDKQYYDMKHANPKVNKQLYTVYTRSCLCMHTLNM